MKLVLQTETNIDMAMHAGDYGKDIDVAIREAGLDIPFRRVRGNCDYASDAPDMLMVEAEGVKILMHHGKGYRVKSTLTKIDYLAREKGADIMIFGHSHLPLLKNMGDLFLLNPGSIGWPKGAGRTYAIVQINPKEAQPIQIDIKRFGKK